MSYDITIAMLLTSGRARRPLSPAEWKRVKARCTWVKATVAKLCEAQRQMDEVCRAAVERLGEEEFNRLFDEEEAKVAAIRAQLDAVIEHDEWPRELYFGGI